MEDRVDIIKDYVGDMLSVEKHTLESIERQTGSDRLVPYTEAYALLKRVEDTLRRHTFALDQYLSTINGGAGPTIKKAMTSAMGAISGLYGMIRPEDPVSRSLRDDYTALSLAAISYTMLHTTAKAINEYKLADLALEHLNDLTPLIVSLSRIIPTVVAKELSDEGKVLYPEAARDALVNTQQAWSHEKVGVFH